MDGSVSSGREAGPVRPSERIDEACDRFEAAWRVGTAPRIEDYLAQADDADRPALLGELVALERELRRRRGERPATQEYLDRFAGDAPVVAAALQETTTAYQGGADLPALVAIAGDCEADGDGGKRTLPEALRAAAVYRPRRHHAQGGLGEVLAAHQEELDRTVALKRIRPDQLHDAARRRFLREAAITARLQHPGIVPIYGLGQDDDGPFYTMPLIAGRTLQEAIDAFHGDESLQRDHGRRAIGFRGLLQQFIVVCETMAYAHDQGVIHRDLKPSNIMLGPYGETLVLDWGLARRLGADDPTPEGERDAPSPSPRPDDLTATGDVLGTPQFMSPEQARGEPATPASDIFCLGLILYAILTGRRPYQGRTLGEVLEKVRRCEFRAPRQVKPGLSRALEAVCLKAMAARPEQRYATALELAADIRRWLADEPVSAWREPLARRARRWLQRHRTAAAAVLSGLLVAAAALGVMYRNRQQAERAEQAQAQQWSLNLLTDEVDAVASLASNLGPIFPRVAGILANRWRDPNLDPQAKLRIALVLRPVDREAREYLADRLVEADAKIVRIIAEGLKTIDARTEVRKFWDLVEDASTPAPHRFRAACGLAILDPPRTRADEDRWSHQIDWVIREVLSSADFPGDEFDRALSPLDGLYLRAVARHCFEGDPLRPLAFRLLRVHAERNRRPDDFFEQARPAALILDADPDDFEWLMRSLEVHREPAIDALRRAARDPDALFADEPALKGHNPSHRQARALIALARLGKSDLSWPPLRRSPEPDLRTWLIHDAGRHHIASAFLIDRLRAEDDPSARAALVLALGGYDPRSIDPQARRDIAARLLDWYRHDPDPGLHGAVSWLLRTRWDLGRELLAIDREMRSRDPLPSRGWFINGQGQTFAVIRGPRRFLMGSPDEVNQSDARERPHEREIPRSFAIATTEVTVAQYREFVEANRALFADGVNYLKRFSPEEDCPINAVKWFEAALYCRWLSEKEKIADDQMCFPSIPEMMRAFESGSLVLKLGYLEGTGYRLPTEAEWEFACRAGTTTPRYFGRAALLLPDYAWFATNSGASTPVEVETRGRTHPVGRLRPNDMGLFDLYGNVREWCLDPSRPYPTSPRPVIDAEILDPVTADDVRITRGGSFVDPPDWTSSAYRNGGIAVQSVASTGFRVVRTVR
jgi:formylglycine-generating enzyme required for sulfatase activity/serine/threonine protein kinase